jgi:hypothetical protein
MTGLVYQSAINVWSAIVRDALKDLSKAESRPPGYANIGGTSMF